MKIYPPHPPLEYDTLFQEIIDGYKKSKKIKSNKMKKYKVVFINDAKGKVTETVIVNADIFDVIKEEDHRYFRFFDNEANLKAIFMVKKVVAIYEV